MNHFGFLPTRATFMLDFVVVAMVAVCVLLCISIYLVKHKKALKAHRNLQTILGVILLITIVAFEVDIQLIKPHWRELAEPSPYYASGWVSRLLLVHLFFAIPTPFFWTGLIVLAYRNMGHGFSNARHRQWHRKAGWIGTGLMVMTAITGWVFYWASFVA